MTVDKLVFIIACCLGFGAIAIGFNVDRLLFEGKNMRETTIGCGLFFFTILFALAALANHFWPIGR